MIWRIYSLLPASYLRKSWRYASLSTFAKLSPATVTLRPYQEACLDSCLEALGSGCTRLGISLPTGSGKTTVFLSLLSRMAPPRANTQANRALIIVNSIELALQAAAQAEKLFPHWSVEIEQGAKHQATGSADITVATYQTLIQSQRLSKFDPRWLKAIIVDEAHHAAAPSYRRLLSHFEPSIKAPKDAEAIGVLPRSHSIPIIGFSATFNRHDGLALGSVFERIVYHRDFLQMIKDQWLCDVRFTTVRAQLDLGNVTLNSRSGDFNATSLAHVVNTYTINKLLVQTWLDRASGRRSTLIFCVNLAHVRDLTQMFRSFGIDARYIFAGTPASERRALISSFKEGTFPVLINCGILTEGADIPSIDCVILARPTRSRNLFAQMIGRGMRLSPDTNKTDCRIIDFVDNTNRVSGVISTPTLFGLDPNETIDDDSIMSLEEKAQEMVRRDTAMNPDTSPSLISNIPEPKSVTYIDHDDPFSLAEDASGAPHVAELSPHSWVGCGDNIYVLECMAKGFVRIEPMENDGDKPHKFRATYTPAINKQTARSLGISPYQRSRVILIAEALRDAVRGCDKYVTENVVKGPLAMGLRRAAKWRSLPATSNQLSVVRKRWGKRQELSTAFGEESDDKANGPLATMTKGEAANIITRLKHGALARFEKKAKAAAKSQKAAAKLDLMRARQVVREGPLQV